MGRRLSDTNSFRGLRITETKLWRGINSRENHPSYFRPPQIRYTNDDHQEPFRRGDNKDIRYYPTHHSDTYRPSNEFDYRLKEKDYIRKGDIQWRHLRTRVHGKRTTIKMVFWESKAIRLYDGAKAHQFPEVRKARHNWRRTWHQISGIQSTQQFKVMYRLLIRVSKPPDLRTEIDRIPTSVLVQPYFGFQMRNY